MTSKAIEAFRLVPDKIQALHKALANPHVQEALKLIELANQPRESDTLPVVAGLHHDCVVSREFHKLLGVNNAIKMLRAMATPPTKTDEEQPPEVPDFFDSNEETNLP